MVVQELITAARSVYGVYKFVPTTPLEDVINDENEWSDCTAITVSISSAVNG
jgi:phage-related baseplate assembly protein